MDPAYCDEQEVPLHANYYPFPNQMDPVIPSRPNRQVRFLDSKYSKSSEPSLPTSENTAWLDRMTNIQVCYERCWTKNILVKQISLANPHTTEFELQLKCRVGGFSNGYDLILKPTGEAHLTTDSVLVAGILVGESGGLFIDTKRTVELPPAVELFTSTVVKSADEPHVYKAYASGWSTELQTNMAMKIFELDLPSRCGLCEPWDGLFTDVNGRTFAESGGEMQLCCTGRTTNMMSVRFHPSATHIDKLVVLDYVTFVLENVCGTPTCCRKCGWALVWFAVAMVLAGIVTAFCFLFEHLGWISP